MQRPYIAKYMEFATIDDSKFPIIFIHIQPVNPTFEQIDKLYDDLDAVLIRHSGKYVAITTAPSQIISSEARVRLGNLAREFYQKYKHREVLSILVAGSTIARIMYQTIQLLFRPFSQSQIMVSSEEEAMKRAIEAITQETSNNC